MTETTTESAANTTNRMFLALVFAGALVPSPAHADDPVCQYTASPRVSLSYGPNLQAGTGLFTLLEHWSVDCHTNCDPSKAIKFWEGIRLVHDADPTVELTGVNSLGPGSDTRVDGADTEVTSPIQGVKIRPILRAGCGDGVQGTDAIEVTGAPIVMPPYLVPAEQIRVLVDDPSFPFGLPVRPATQIPIGYRFRIRTLIGATPKGAELVTVHVEGAGIHFMKQYGAGDDDVGERLANDPAAQFVANQVNTIAMWVEFEGMASDIRRLMAVAYDREGRPITADTPATDPPARTDSPRRSGTTRGRGTRRSPPPHRMSVGTLETALVGGPALALLAMLYERMCRRARRRSVPGARD